MDATAIAGRTSPLAMLRRIAQGSARAATLERCELCNIPLAERHRHLLDASQHRIACACDPCALRFQNVVDGRFQLIPRDARPLPGFRLDDAQWDSLALPIDLVFFFQNRSTGKVTAMYPSPAGATESLLPLSTWQALVEENPVLATLQPDVEALLVNRVRQARQYYVAPIDLCYELVGLMRMHWRGLSGGEAVWKEIDAFFGRLEAGHG